MRFTIKVKANSKKEEVKRSENGLVVSLKAEAKEGKANKELIRVLSEYFGVTKSRIKIIRGLSARTKTVEVEE